MCGIAGFVADADIETLTNMLTCLAHRGPDGDGYRIIPSRSGKHRIGFGHRRLAIIDLSPRGAQPMTVQCQQCGATTHEQLSLVFNGEIYNFRELREGLVARGHSFSSATDSEVLLHLFAERGPTMFAMLNGIFALAIHDGRTRHRADGIEQGDVVVARDHLGVKPFYHTQTPRGFFFSSELKSLTGLSDADVTLDPVAIHETLAYLWTPAPRTVLQSVRKLKPGHYAIVRDGRMRDSRAFYDLPHPAARFRGSEAEAASAVEEAVAVAVERQLVSDVPVGAFLSGGLDSSAVVAMMRRANPDLPAMCYSIDIVAPGGNDGHAADLPFARRVAAHLDVPLREIRIGADIIDRLPEMLWHLDEPQADPAPLNALVIAEHARADGIKVLLSGAGGDDIFTGYRRHRALMFERYWDWLPPTLRTAAVSATKGTANMLLRNMAGNSHVRRGLKALEYADRGPDERLASYFLWGTSGMREGLYSDELRHAINGANALAPMFDTLRDVPSHASRLEKMLHLELRHFLADHNLNYTDKMGMAAGVEIRVPLLDLDLVALAASLPDGMKQRGAEGKAIFKRAMEPYLPHEVIYRPKTGFGAPLRQWLAGPLRPVVDDVLSERSLTRRGLFSPRAVKALVQADRVGRVDAAYTIFAVICLELWCRQFVDRAGARLAVAS